MPYKSKLWWCFFILLPSLFFAGAVTSLIFDVPEAKPISIWTYSLITATCWIQAYYLGTYLTIQLIPPTKLIFFPKPWYPDGTVFGLVFHTIASNVFSLRLAEGRWSLGPARSKKTMICRMEDRLAEAHEALTSEQVGSADLPGFTLLEKSLADTIIEIMDFSAGFGLNVGGAVEARTAWLKAKLDEQSAPPVPEKLPPQGLDDNHV